MKKTLFYYILFPIAWMWVHWHWEYEKAYKEFTIQSDWFWHHIFSELDRNDKGRNRSIISQTNRKPYKIGA